MKKIHYQNIGYPKAATSWLWKNLANHSEVDSFKDIPPEDLNNGESMEKLFQLKENGYQNRDKIIDKEEYRSIYQDYEVTMNFSIFTYILSDSKIATLADYTTHASIILRNPYELFNSWYNYKMIGQELHKVEQELFLKTFPTWLNLPLTITKWRKFKKPFIVLYYDDIVSDDAAFYSKVCNFLSIKDEPLTLPHKVNETKYTITAPISESLISQIDEQILQASDLLGRDLTHWMRLSGHTA